MKNSFECDCPEGYERCKADKKCVKSARKAELCSTLFADVACPAEMPFKCPDNSCAVDEANCLSQPGCPPGYELCLDQTCAAKGTCASSFEACSGAKPIKCEDQTCQADIRSCQQRVVCPYKNMVICPDQTCVYSELQCTLPNKCEQGQVLCKDQSCRLSYSDCPQTVQCPTGTRLCSDSSCNTNCTDIMDPAYRKKIEKLPKRLRLLAEATNTPGQLSACASGEVRCPGGECRGNFMSCPTKQTCPADMSLCSDLSCVEILRDCIVQVCQNNKIHCWDGKVPLTFSALTAASNARPSQFVQSKAP